MSDSRIFGQSTVAATAAAAFCVALFALFVAAATTSAQAPYPPTEPCSVSATARGPGTTDGTSDYDVVGSGLGSSQPVRVVLASTGRQLGAAQTDEAGSFRTVVTAPAYADASVPDLTVSSPQRTCTSPPASPPTGPSTSPSPPETAPTAGSGNGSGNGSGGAGTSGNGSGPSAAPNDGTSPGSDSGSARGGSGGGSITPGTAQPGTSESSSPDASGGTSSAGPVVASAPPLAQPAPGSDTPFGIGLGIAAVLLVLGTLAVLLLTRRPER